MRRITCLVIAAVIATTSSSLAQTQPTLAGTVINVNDLLAPWLPILMNAFMGIVLALLSWAAWQIKKRTGVVVENAHMQALQKAIQNGAGLALAKLTTKAKTVSIDVKSDIVRQGVEYVNPAAADSVASFGLTPEQVAEKIIAQMSVISAPNPGLTIKDTTPPPPNTGAGS